MSETVSVAVPRKGRPLEAVLERLASLTGKTAVADSVVSTLRYEKAITKGDTAAEPDVYDRLAEYSSVETAAKPEYTLLRDDRPGMPRRVVFDSITLDVDGVDVRLVGREEPFRSLRTHEFALGFDSADLVLEEVVDVRGEPLERIDDLNARIDPDDTDVRVVVGLGDTVSHTLLATRETRHAVGTDAVDRDFLRAYEGPLCISPRYERLVQAVIGTAALEGVSYVYPGDAGAEEAAIADVGLGVYLTKSGSTARDHGLVVGEQLFPSETVLFENETEVGTAERRLIERIDGVDVESQVST